MSKVGKWYIKVQGWRSIPSGTESTWEVTGYKLIIPNVIALPYAHIRELFESIKFSLNLNCFISFVKN